MIRAIKQLQTLKGLNQSAHRLRCLGGLDPLPQIAAEPEGGTDAKKRERPWNNNTIGIRTRINEEYVLTSNARKIYCEFLNGVGIIAIKSQASTIGVKKCKLAVRLVFGITVGFMVAPFQVTL